MAGKLSGATHRLHSQVITWCNLAMGYSIIDLIVPKDDNDLALLHLTLRHVKLKGDGLNMNSYWRVEYQNRICRRFESSFDRLAFYKCILKACS